MHGQKLGSYIALSLIWMTSCFSLFKRFFFSVSPIRIYWNWISVKTDISSGRFKVRRLTLRVKGSTGLKFHTSCLIIMIIMFIEIWKECIVGKNTYFYSLHCKYTLHFLFFKPKGSRLVNQEIVGIHFEKTNNKCLSHVYS